MDETTATIQRGCRLARELEENLENWSNTPEVLSRYCDEIIMVFSHVKERISYSAMVSGAGRDQQSQQQLAEMPSGVQEWLRSGTTQAVDHLLLPQVQLLRSSRGTAFGLHGGVLPEPTMESEMREINQRETATGLVETRGRDAEVSMRLGDDVQPRDVSYASRGSSSSQRQRRRRNEGEKRIERVPAPRMGNTEIPPEDGHTWRKYGQKDILNSRFPRSYFRCTHQKLYNCPAKKLVQRLDDDPDMFEVTYRGEHTCHFSSTAPSGPPPPSLQVRHDIINPQPPAILQPHPPPGSSSGTVPLSHWLSMDIIRPPTGEGTSTNITAGMQMYRDLNLTTAGPSSSGAGAGPGPSSAVTRFGDYQPVTDLADVMFNSGSSSSNSMDFIFPSMDDKWDSGGKKN